MTLDEVEALSDVDLRIKVAELLGWRRCDTADGCYYRGEADAYGYYEEHSDNFDGEQLLPDYTGDLNVCREMVETLRSTDGPEWYDFQTHLLCICGSVMNAVQATARARCVAFVATKTGTK